MNLRLFSLDYAKVAAIILRLRARAQLLAGVVELVDTMDSKFSSDFVSQVKIKLFCGVPVKGFAGSIKKDCRQTISVFSARVVKLVDTGDKRKPVSLKN